MATKKTTKSTKRAPAKQVPATSFSGAIDRMAPSLAFKSGMISGAFLLFAVLSVFLFLWVAFGGGFTESGAKNDPYAADNGLLPEPYPQVTFEVELKEDDHVQGSRDAEFLLVEYSDLECPFCQRLHVDDTVPGAMEQLESEGISTAWVFRHYPLPFHEGADVAAEMTECVAEEAGDEGFWQFTEAYFEETASNGEGIPQDEVIELAVAAGATADGFAECLDSERYADDVASEIAEAEREYNMGTEYGTPTTFVVDTTNGNTRAIVGAVDQALFLEAIEVMQGER